MFVTYFNTKLIEITRSEGYFQCIRLFPPSVPTRNYNKFTEKIGKFEVVPVNAMKV